MPKNKPHIFISYSKQDVELAKAVVDRLTAFGWELWWDRNIPANKNYDDVIQQNLKAAKCAIVLWTAHSIKSNYVKIEAKEAKRKGKLISIMAGNIKLPLVFRDHNSLKWKETNQVEEDKMNELIRHLKPIAGKPVAKASSYRLDINPFVTNQAGFDYPLKLEFTITNNHSYPITIESISFEVASSLRIAPKASREHRKPRFKIGREKIQGKDTEQDVYADRCTLNPSESVRAWLPIDPKIGEKTLREAMQNKKAGIWKYHCWLNEQLSIRNYKENF